MRVLDDRGIRGFPLSDAIERVFNAPGEIVVQKAEVWSKRVDERFARRRGNEAAFFQAYIVAAHDGVQDGRVGRGAADAR